MVLKEITNILEEYAPLKLQEDYDNAGLLCGSADLKIKGILICIDVTERIIDEAIQKQANLIVSHHPLIFSGLKKVTGSNYVERILIKAIRNSIAIYAAHTNLDKIEGGVNSKICQKLGLIDCRMLSSAQGEMTKLKIFVPSEFETELKQALSNVLVTDLSGIIRFGFSVSGSITHFYEQRDDNIEKKLSIGNQYKKFETIVSSYLLNKIAGLIQKKYSDKGVIIETSAVNEENPGIGMGMIGTLEQKTSEKDFFNLLKERFEIDCIRHSPFLGKSLKRVAVCGGSGSFLIKRAITSGADVYITGDVKYHQFFDADNKILIADIGHYESEQFTKEIFYELLTKKISTFVPCFISEINTNVIHYY